MAGIQSLSIRLNTEKLDYPVEDLKNSLLALRNVEGPNHSWRALGSGIKRDRSTIDFAFAVFLLTDSGDLITKGDAVENKFTIRYVLPALKEFENAYHTISKHATYAVAAFPPAKFYFVVEDLQGNRVNIVYPTVDFRDEFNHPQEYNEDKQIVVPLKIKPRSAC